MRTHHEDTANEVHGEYRWRTFAPGDLSLTDGTLEEAAEAMDLAAEEVEWACGEFGRCDTQYPTDPGFGIVCWRPGEIEIGTDDEPIGGGYEWPATEAPIDPAEDHAEFLRQQATIDAVRAIDIHKKD